MGAIVASEIVAVLLLSSISVFEAEDARLDRFRFSTKTSSKLGIGSKLAPPNLELLLRDDIAVSILLNS